MRRKNNREDQTNKNTINTSTTITKTNTIFLPKKKHIEKSDIETNYEPPNTDCTKITTKYIEVNNNPKIIVIKNNSSSNKNKNDNISVSRDNRKNEQKKKTSKSDEDKNYSG